MKSFEKLLAISILTPALWNVTNIKSVKANNEFDICIQEIVSSGVEANEAQTACADALIPRELSSCVTNISRNTAIKGDEALKNCYLVRRPVEMANCVVNINKNVLANTQAKVEETPPKIEDAETLESMMETVDKTEDKNAISPINKALETCTSTILPSRHSQCVIALSRTPQAQSPIKAMETCIDAEDFPIDLFTNS